MDPANIRELLKPFTIGLELADQQIEQLSAYLNLLIKWNAKMNLTAVRAPEAIIRRHFGESIFAAILIASNCTEAKSLADFGSGAGFPGLPIKITIPKLGATLIESQQKKATFLKEVIRELKLSEIQVLNARAESVNHKFGIVTLRAVESFEKVLPVAAKLIAPGGCLVLLIGSEQMNTAGAFLPDFQWAEPNPIPHSDHRVVLIGRRA